MYQHDWILSKLAEGRQRDLMRRLEHDRLVRQAAFTSHPQRHAIYHTLDWMGRQMVRWGERLQARHAMYHRQTLNHNLGG